MNRTPGLYEVKIFDEKRVVCPWSSYAPSMPDALRHAAERAKESDFPAPHEYSSYDKGIDALSHYPAHRNVKTSAPLLRKIH